ncbi:MAG TPA: PfkB family carbohydrate kinase [Thermomicrobiaceae bacterium]|nr:PfkB family carbohydrate kinase [Thermomicrobiaceae bacterium]
MTESSSGTAPVICAGEVLIDLIGDPAGPVSEVRHFKPRIGGAPANVAAGLARLSVRAAFAGAAGDDEFGVLCREALVKAGVETRHLRTVTGTNTRLAIVTGPAQNRTFRFYGQPAADEHLTGADLLAALTCEGCAALYFGALPLASEPSRTAMLDGVAWTASRPEPVPFCFDPNPRRAMFEARPELRPLCHDLIGQARIVKVSRSDLKVLDLNADELPALARPGALVVISDGGNGCQFWIDGEPGYQRAFAVHPIDETGAGDAFMAALIARGVANDFQFAPDDMEFAAAAGALATSKMGAIAAMPSWGEIEKVVKMI